MNTDSTNSSQAGAQCQTAKSPFERRLTLFTLGLTRSLDISNLTYFIILFIEFLQVISILIDGKFYAQWNGLIFQYFKLVLGFISTQGVISQDPNSIVTLLIIGNILLFLLAVGIVFSICYGSEMLNTSQTQKIGAKIIAFFMLLGKTLFQIPFMIIIVSGFSQTAVSGSLVIGLSSSLLILTLPLFLYVIMFFSDGNPFSPFVYAGQNHYYRIACITLKIGLVFYQVLDKNRVSQLGILIAVMAIKLLTTVAAIYSPMRLQFKKNIRKIKYWQDYLIFWFVLFMVLSRYTCSDPKMFLYFFIIAFVGLSFIDYFQENIQESVITQNFILLGNPKRIEYHILRLLELVDTFHERASRILLQGYIAFHARNCSLPDSSCTCKQVSVNSCSDIEARKHLYYEFIINLLKGALNRSEDPRRIYFLLSFVYHYRLNNKFQTIHTLLRTKSMCKNLMERIESYSQLKIIELEINQAESKKNWNLAIDIMKFLKFNLKIVEFEQTLDECSNNHIEFWNQILQINLNIQKLENCGAIIAKQKEVVKNCFHQMSQLNRNNAHIMILYGQFLSWVCNQDFQNSKLLEKGQTIMKNLKQSSKINDKNEKYSENSEISIIVISGNENQLGDILQTNNFVKQALGYHRKQLITQNIKLLMPKIFADYHTLSLDRYLQTSKEKYVGIERLVPVLHKDGFIIPSLTYTKQIPNLEEGIQLVGFISSYDHIEQDQYVDEKVSYIVYECTSEIIMGISKNCQIEYGIPQCLVYGSTSSTSDEMKIKHIFGMSLQKSGLQKQKQIMATIDTKSLKNEFVITSTTSTRKIIEQSALIEVKTQVLIKSIFELPYHGYHLRMISVTKNYDKKDDDCKRKSIKSTHLDVNKEERSDSKSESDDLKNLKDFKNFISIKREPRAIRFISLICIALIFVFFLGAGGFVILHIYQFDYIDATMEGIRLAFLNRMYMTELSFEFEKIIINHNDFYSPGEQFPQQPTIKKMVKIIEQARDDQQQILPIKNYLGVKKLYINYFDFYLDSTYTTSEKSIDEAITIQLSKFYFITSTNGDYFRDEPLKGEHLSVRNYLQTKYSQVFSFTPACNSIQEMITQQGINKTENTKLLLIIETVVLIFFSLLWIFVSLPKTLQVVQINSKVLSLFNLISPEDVRAVINRCYIFQSKYLVEANVDEKKMIDLSVQVNKEFGALKRKSINSNLRDSNPGASPGGSLNASCLDTSSRVIMTAEARFKDTGGKDNFDDSENENKMIDKGNRDRNKAIVTFLLIFLFLIAYAGSVTGYLILQYKNLQTESKIMNIIYNRAAQFQEIKTAYTKYLTERTLNFNGQNIGSINLELIGKIYDTERSLVEEGLYSQFSSFINSLNTQNLCDSINSFHLYRVWGDDNLSVQECQQVGNGILTRGIKTSLVTIMQQIRSMILLPQTDKNKLDIYTLTIETIGRYTILQKYIIRPLIMISSKIQQTKIKNSLKINIIFYLINGVFMLLVLIFWRVAWRKYLNYLNESVWRTKSMLNVIPSKIITNNEQLMSQFTSGQLEKIVK